MNLIYTAAAGDYTTFHLHQPDWSFGWFDAFVIGGLVLFVVTLLVMLPLDARGGLTRRWTTFGLTTAVLGLVTFAIGFGAAAIGVNEIGASERMTVTEELNRHGITVSGNTAGHLLRNGEVTVEHDGKLTVIELHTAVNSNVAGLSVNGQPV